MEYVAACFLNLRTMKETRHQPTIASLGFDLSLSKTNKQVSCHVISRRRICVTELSRKDSRKQVGFGHGKCFSMQK